MDILPSFGAYFLCTDRTMAAALISASREFVSSRSERARVAHGDGSGRRDGVAHRRKSRAALDDRPPALRATTHRQESHSAAGPQRHGFLSRRCRVLQNADCAQGHRVARIDRRPSRVRSPPICIVYNECIRPHAGTYTHFLSTTPATDPTSLAASPHNASPVEREVRGRALRGHAHFTGFFFRGYLIFNILRRVFSVELRSGIRTSPPSLATCCSWQAISLYPRARKHTRPSRARGLHHQRQTSIITDCETGGKCVVRPHGILGAGPPRDYRPAPSGFSSHSFVM